MATLANKVIKYLEANGKTSAELGQAGANVQIVNNTGTDEIAVWNVSGVSEPTTDQLNSYTSAVDADEANVSVMNTRRSLYGDVGAQLNLLYDDMTNNKLDTSGEWYKKIKAIKDANPKG